MSETRTHTARSSCGGTTCESCDDLPLSLCLSCPAGTPRECGCLPCY